MCFLFPIHLYCLAVPRDRTSTFPSRFFQAETHIHAFYTSPTAGSGDVQAARGSQACHRRGRDAPDLLCGPVSSTQLQQATCGLSAACCSQAISSSQAPAVQKASEVEMIFFFFPFPCTNPVSDRGHTPGSWFSKALEVQDRLASSTSEVHWNQQVYSWLKGVLLLQEISRCCTFSLCPPIRTLQSQVPDVNRNCSKAPYVFSSRSLAKMRTPILLLVPWAQVQTNLPRALISGCSLSSFSYHLTKLSNPPDFALSMQ